MEPSQPGGDSSGVDTEKLLLPLRQELQLHEAPRGHHGGREWTLFDPLRQSFYRIGWLEFSMLSRWHLAADAADLCRRLKQEEGLEVSLQDIEELQRFLLKNQLLRIENPAYTGHLLKLHRDARQKPWRSLLKNYLFVRIPLVRPDRALGRLLPRVRWLVSRPARITWGIMVVLGLYLVSRQWDSFSQTFLYFFTPQGLAGYVVVILLVKIAHELGHALTAKYYGLKVPTMGVAFLVLWPVLYTDTTDAWKLKSRHARLMITAAGMFTELVIAGIATFLWSFLPEGFLKSAAFMVATVSWVMTLAVNLNPFMRFDGYYLLADLTEISNLQDRSFALGRWWLRRYLLGIEMPLPEQLPVHTRRWLIAYAMGTWLYRFLLFLAIALLVYHLFFKLLGIILMAAEIVLFIGMPVSRELRTWYQMRDTIHHKVALKRSALGLAAVLLLLVVPWQGDISHRAVLRPAQYSRLYSPEPARIRKIQVREGELVKQGQLIIELDSPDLEFSLLSDEVRARALQWQMARSRTVSALLEFGQLTEENFAEALARYRTNAQRFEQLQIRAPFDGRLVQLDETLADGRWINPDLPLAVVADEQLVVVCYVSEREVERLQTAATGRFYPAGNVYRPLDLRVISIDRVSTRQLEEPWLASLYGGDVAVVRDKQGKMLSHEAVYRVLLGVEAVKHTAPPSMLRGTVYIDAERRSMIGHIWQVVASVIIRESGF